VLAQNSSKKNNWILVNQKLSSQDTLLP